ncbi:ABC transporter ATP-binding protein [Flavihumibacter rivuli]|uniref:ABC transporter ATP-binding protein n=1 Tax=Flavihumibacter rivuli TaxID=2838156 RepID=UPI001BDED1D1|nr:ABC transporter ATP-binding protein [Flavihumibacter rivuli]ULQ58229.1 ABC transporter ATP-binding protein [Flavihumibacter rivuli]
MTGVQPYHSTENNSTRGENVIEINNLDKSFGDLVVLNHFNLSLKRGENVVVLGKSGCGKSVLIKCIIGLMKPDEGNITVLGQSIPDLSQEELDRIRVKIGFLFQSNALYDSMTVRENLEFPLRRHWIHVSHEEVNDLVMEALENVGLAHTVDMMPVELSGGMRKRIALARTLILKPEIILYDEPTTGLDPITSREISNLMVEIQGKYNTSSLIISHDMNCIRTTADRIVLLMDGIAYANGTFEQLKASEDPRIKQFFIEK